DWNADTSLCEQAKSLVRARKSAGISIPALLKEQREYRDMNPVGTLIYLFHNVIVSELDNGMEPNPML
ncbi:hypothetical protein QBC32DRAFT_214458, partial [Pseudoneurospora amorphoporcata]